MLNLILLFSTVFLDVILSADAVELLTPNVALNGEAKQSSSYHHRKPINGIEFDDPDEAHYAIDRNFGTDLDSGDRCAVTGLEAGVWWQVDLKYQFKLEKVAVTVRREGVCSEGATGCDLMLCNTTTDQKQCPPDEICNSLICQTAHVCSGQDDCSNFPETMCMNGYCQPRKCTFNGECVHGQVCSHNGKCTLKPTQEDLKIAVSASETEVTLTCSIVRIKPEAADMFFTIGGQKHNGTISSMINRDLTVTNSLRLSLPKFEDDNEVQCTVVPVFGEPLLLVKDTANSSERKIGLILGVVAAVLVVLIIAIAVIVLLIKRYRCFIVNRNDPQSESVTTDGPATVSSTVQSADYEYLQPDNFNYLHREK